MKFEHFTKSQLKDIKRIIDWDDYKDEVGNESVNAYSLLHGQCLQYAGLLSETLTKKGFDCHVDSLYMGDTLVHAYCVVDQDGKKLYLDVRGTYDTYSEFMQEFIGSVAFNEDDDEEDSVNNNDIEFIHIMSIIADIVDLYTDVYVDDINKIIYKINDFEEK